jgi:hypothetical protein
MQSQTPTQTCEGCKQHKLHPRHVLRFKAQMDPDGPSDEDRWMHVDPSGQTYDCTDQGFTGHFTIECPTPECRICRTDTEGGYAWWHCTGCHKCIEAAAELPENYDEAECASDWICKACVVEAVRLIDLSARRSLFGEGER